MEDNAPWQPPWTGQNSPWSPASTTGPRYNPVPNLQHLSLTSEHHLLAATEHHNQDHQRNRGVPEPSPHAHYEALCRTSGAGHSSPPTAFHASSSTDQNAPPVHVLSTTPVVSPGKNVPPPSSLPVASQHTQSCRPQPLSPCAPCTSHKASPPPVQPPCAHQGLFNGPKSPHREEAAVPRHPMQQCVNQGPQSLPQTMCGRPPDLGSPPHPPFPPPGGFGYNPSHTSPTSPVHQQAQWAPPPHYSGVVSESVPAAADPPCRKPSEQENMSPSSESRYGLDPKLLPSAVKVMAEDRAEWEGKVFTSEPCSSLPPLATTACIIEDMGSASPRAIRSTCYCVPCEGQTASLSHLPLGALITPLATAAPGERSLPVCSETECVRGCAECGAYMCPAMGWQDCGQRFCCPFCGKLSEVPWQYYQPTKGVDGVRVDRANRPELSMGSYEILNSQKDEAAALLLAVDVSASALRGGQLDFITQQIQSLLTSLNRKDGGAQSDVRVGLMTYDSRLHLYDLSPALFRPHMLVVTETEDLQLPVKEGLLVALKDCIDSLGSVLQRLPLFTPECDDSSGVPLEMPLTAALTIFQAMSCSGKLLVFHTAPLVEAHAHCSSAFFGSNKPKSIFQPPEFAVSLANDCISQGCGVHLYILSQQEVGGAWPGHVPYLTGGALYTYSSLQGEMDRQRFSTDLRRSVETETGYKAQLKIHVSKDLRVSGCYGMVVPGPCPSQVALAALDGRTTLAVELTHCRPLDDKRPVAIQAVLSYSSQRGERRTRVHTLTLRCSRHLQDIFRHCQAQTLLTFYCKRTYCAVLERPLQELREELQAEVTEALACYRKHCSSASVSAGQLVLPQYLRALPVYINSLRKSEVVLPGLQSSVPQRLQLRYQLLHMDTSSTASHFYPTLLPLPLSADVSGAASSPSLADAVRCSAASLDPAGVYLVHGPLALLLWVGSQVPGHALVQLFNASCFLSVPSGQTKLPILDNSLSICIRSFIDTLEDKVPYARKLWVVKQGDGCEEALQRQLVEDKSPNGGASYADFLYHLHVNSVRLQH